MNLAELKYVRVGERDYPVKLTQRAMIEYEKLTGEAIISFRGSERLSKLFYVTAKAGARATSQPFDYDYEGFLDLVDDYYLDILNNFGGVIFGDTPEQSEVTEEDAEEAKKK